MPTPTPTRCPVCGCHSQRRCHAIGHPAMPGDKCTGRTGPITARSHPVYACTMKPDGRCSHCQKCHQCGGPLGDKPQLILSGGHKLRLCKDCQCVPTGDTAFDALCEALLTGDPAVVAAAGRKWNYKVPEPVET